MYSQGLSFIGWCFELGPCMLFQEMAKSTPKTRALITLRMRKTVVREEKMPSPPPVPALSFASYSNMLSSSLTATGTCSNLNTSPGSARSYMAISPSWKQPPSYSQV